MSGEHFDPERAAAVQRRLAGLVERRDRLGPVRLVAGADAAFDGDRGVGAVAVLDAERLETVEVRTAAVRVPVPYRPGLLAFREVPPIRAAFRKLTRRPDLLLVDGSGLIHPRRFGLACHLGVVLDVPAIGCAKSPFIGEWGEPGAGRGSWSPVTERGEVLGAALRTRDGVKVLFISTGHRVSLETAIRWSLRAATVARLPEPIRAAHHAAGLARTMARER